MTAINILVDSAMPYWQECFESFGEVRTFVAGDLAQDNGVSKKASLDLLLPSVDYLLVRSTTQVKKALIDKMPNLKFVGTATAGYDHFDTEYLAKRDITWYAAGGCNAQAVAQYVLSAILFLAQRERFLIGEKRVCVIGNGNVGTKVAKSFTAFGADLVIYDPPQESRNKVEGVNYVTLDEALNADIICMHAPLNSDEKFPSKHLLDAKRLSTIRPDQYIINAGRGELIDNQALLNECQSRDAKQRLNVVLDVWEDEPNIKSALIPYMRLATPHIAGHTIEGKARGTFMLHNELCRLQNVPAKLSLEEYLPHPEKALPAKLVDAFEDTNSNNAEALQVQLKNLCDFSYDILNDDSVFRAHMAQSPSFAILRRQYPNRREFSAQAVNVRNTKINELLRTLGFIISNDSNSPL